MDRYTILITNVRMKEKIKKKRPNLPLTAIIDYSSNIANGAYTLTAYEASARHEFVLESRGRSFA